MSKYVIEFDKEQLLEYDKDTDTYFRTLYKAKGFNALVFDKVGLDKLTPLDKALSSELGEAYHKGMEEGKKQAKVQAHLDVCHDIERVAHGNYQKGLDDAWNAAKQLITKWVNDDDDVFGDKSMDEFIETFSASEAISKLKAYEEKQKADEIKVGDEVRNTSGLMDNVVGHFIGTTIEGDCKVLRYIDGIFKTGIWRRENCIKTGKHSYAVERMVAVMKEGAE